jgi:predicted RNA-binding Zn ribbon-like protein
MKFQIIADELSLDFINTLDNRPVPERLRELLNSYADLTDWAVQAGAIDASSRERLIRESETHPEKAAAALHRAINFREALYRIVSNRLGKQPIADVDRHSFDAALSEASSHLQLQTTRKGFRLDWPHEPVNLNAILWPIVRSAAQLLTSGDLEYIRECGSETCRWLFVDRSKNHRRRWCDMKVCGNRAKVRNFYRRAKR